MSGLFFLFGFYTTSIRQKHLIFLKASGIITTEIIRKEKTDHDDNEIFSGV